MKEQERVKFPISRIEMGEEEIQAASDVIRSGWISQGPKVLAFESEFKNYVGSNYATAVSSCTAALHLTLLAIGVKPDDYVITVSHSFIATANCIRYCGADPLFIDIDPETYNMSPSALKNFLNEKCFILNKQVYLQEEPKRRIAAILVVHQLGMPCDLNALLSISNQYHLPLVEDAACAIGSEISLDQGQTFEKIGKPHGVAACFSFHPRKVLSTGEGGMITTNDEKIDQTLRHLRQHGMTVTDLERYRSKKLVQESYDTLGYNFRMTDIQAAIGIEQLKKLPTILKRRREIDQHYRELLGAIDWIILPKESKEMKSNWQSYPIRILPHAPKSRDEIMQSLFAKGIATKPGVMNAHQELPYQNVSVTLLESEKARKEVILLPFCSNLKDSDLQYIVSSLKNVGL